MSSITEQVHDDGALGDRLFDPEEVLAWDPAILLCVLPRLAILSNTDDYIQTLITHVQRLGMALRPVPDDRHRVILEVFLTIISMLVEYAVKRKILGASQQASRLSLNRWSARVQ